MQLEGNVVEVVYKGRSLRLVLEDKPSIMSRLVKRNDELRTSWEAKWDEKL